MRLLHPYPKEIQKGTGRDLKKLLFIPAPPQGKLTGTLRDLIKLCNPSQPQGKITGTRRDYMRLLHPSPKEIQKGNLRDREIDKPEIEKLEIGKLTVVRQDASPVAVSSFAFSIF